MNGSDNEILAEIERTGVAHTAYWCNWEKMRRVEDPDAVVTESDLPCPFFNNVFSARFDDSHRAKRVDARIHRYQQLNVPFFWWSGPATLDPRMCDLLVDRGLVRAFEAPAMARPLPEPVTVVDERITIREVNDSQAMADWSRTCAEAFEFDDQLAEWWTDLHTAVPFGPDEPLRHYIGCADGETVATASSFVSNATVSLASVSVLPEFRRQGFGTAITRRILQDAMMRECRLAVLFASDMATAMYKQIGFAQYGSGVCYLWQPPDENRAPAM